MSGAKGRSTGLAVDTRVPPNPVVPKPEHEPVEFDPSTIDVVVRSGIKLVVLDFDLCILRIHSCGCKLTPEQVMYRHPLETDFNDLLFFTGMVRALLAADVAVAIASFGKYDVIQTYMDRAFGIDAPLMPDGNPPPMVPGRLFTRDNISTPSVVGAKDGYTHPLRKNPQLAKLMAERGLTETQLMFFDDDGVNVAFAAEAGYIYSIHCPEGFTARYWAAARRLLQQRAGGGPVATSSGSSDSSSGGAEQPAVMRCTSPRVGCSGSASVGGSGSARGRLPSPLDPSTFESRLPVPPQDLSPTGYAAFLAAHPSVGIVAETPHCRVGSAAAVTVTVPSLTLSPAPTTTTTTAASPAAAAAAATAGGAPAASAASTMLADDACTAQAGPPT